MESEAEKGIEKKIDEPSHKSLALWASDCAKHVLPYFEEQCAKDNRPRQAIAAGRAWVRGKVTVGEVRAATLAAHAAARDANDTTARAAARSAGHAAATAHVASVTPRMPLTMLSLPLRMQQRPRNVRGNPNSFRSSFVYYRCLAVITDRLSSRFVDRDAQPSSGHHVPTLELYLVTIKLAEMYERSLSLVQDVEHEWHVFVPASVNVQ